MSELKLEIGKKYLYRNGGIGLVVLQEPDGCFVSIALDKHGIAKGWCRHGFNTGGNYDFVAEHVEPPPLIEYWVNVYAGTGANGDFATKEEAARIGGAAVLRTVLMREVRE